MPEAGGEGERGNGAGRLSPLKFALLGLVALRPMSGYELKLTFDRSIFYIWNVTGAQIYNTLRTLRDEDLISSEHIAQKGKPDKQIHTITDRGRLALQDHANGPIEDELSREVVLLRFFFGNFADSASIARQVQDYLQRIRAEQAYLESVERRVTAHPGRNHEARRFQLLALRLKLAQLRAAEDELVRSGFGAADVKPRRAARAAAE